MGARRRSTALITAQDTRQAGHTRNSGGGNKGSCGGAANNNSDTVILKRALCFFDGFGFFPLRADHRERER